MEKKMNLAIFGSERSTFFLCIDINIAKNC